MIFTVRRRSYFPIVLEPEEEQTLNVLEKQQRWIELEEFEQDLRRNEALKELKVECTQLEEILVFLNTINCHYPITLSFQKKSIIIEDNGDEIQ